MQNKALKHLANVLQMFYFTCNHGLNLIIQVLEGK